MGSLFKEHLFSSLAAEALEMKKIADASTIEKRIILSLRFYWIGKMYKK